MKIVLSVLLVVPLLAEASSVRTSSQRSFGDLLTGFGTRQVALTAPGLPSGSLAIVQEVGKDFFCAKWVGGGSVKWDGEGTVMCYPLKDVRRISLPSPEAAKQPPVVDVGGS